MNAKTSITPKNPVVNKLLQAALDYAASGLEVFPIKAGQKAPPLTMNGLKDATTDPEKIKHWWGMWPKSNIGIRCTGLLVPDFDGKIGAESKAQLETKFGKLPATWTIKTGGGTKAEPKEQGLHHVYKVTKDLNVRPGAGKYGYPGFDIRANDSYIVAAPSVTRLPYETIDNSPIADAPAWLLALVSASKTDKGEPKSTPIEPLKEGNRHSSLVSYAGKLRARGFSQQEIETLGMALNRDSEDPLPDDEALAILRQYKDQVASVRQYEPPPPIESEKIQVFNANAPPSRKDVPHLFDIAERGKFLPVGEATTAFAQGGAGKSITGADYLPLLLANGVLDSSFCALGQGNVVILDWEADIETHRRYITAIKRGLSKRVHTDLDSGIIHYMPLYSPIPLHADFIRSFIRDNNIILVVVDSQMAAMAGAFTSMKDDQLAGIYYNILASWETTTLTIDHVPKSVMNTDFGTGAAYGSVVKYNRARSVFELKQAQEPGENIIELAFVNQKNNLGPKLKPFGLKIEFNNDTDGDLDKITFDTFDLADSSKLEKLRPLWEKARDVIMWELAGRASTGQLATQLETSEAVIRSTLNRYTKVFIKLEKTINGTIWGIHDYVDRNKAA